jgi:membrane associated rhomboid family serine protease
MERTSGVNFRRTSILGCHTPSVNGGHGLLENAKTLTVRQPQSSMRSTKLLELKLSHAYLWIPIGATKIACRGNGNFQMPICPRCGQEFSSFSFGSKPATECKDCRKVTAAVAAATPAGVKFTPTVTLTLIALNALVYVAMGVSGVSWTAPSIEHAVRWGADFGPLTLSGEWWRALTSTFVHFGIIHIAFNMWCLWSLGSSLELFMGRKAFTVIYVLSGLMASLTSIAWNPWRVSAGASGAIFGVAGAFVSYLYFKKAPMDPKDVRQKLKNLLIFIGYNLLYGAAGNVDNSAHLGGLIAGLILGSLAPAILRRANMANPVAGALPSASTPVMPTALVELTPDQVSRVDRVTWQIALGGLVVLFGAAIWIHGRNIPAVHYGKAIALVKAGQLNPGIAELEQAVALNSSLYFPPALLGELHLEQGNPAAAIPVLEHTMSVVPAYYVAHNLALAYLGSGRPLDAEKEITSAMQFEKEDVWRAQYILALAAEQSGDSRLAAENLRSVIQSKPDLREAREALVRLAPTAMSGSVVEIPYSKLLFKSKAWPLYP